MTSWVKSTYVKLPEMVMSQQSGVFPYGAVSSERSITGVRLFTRTTLFLFFGLMNIQHSFVKIGAVLCFYS
jgi:hypothetical protein